MKQEAYDILKSAITEHRELLLSGRQTCLGLLRDYGGREHPEVNLFAEAVEENIPDRLMRSQPVTQQIIDSLAQNFAARNCYDPQVSNFVVSSWADVLGLYRLEKTILTNSKTTVASEPEYCESSQTAERTWYYQDGTNTIGPVLESLLPMLVKSGNVHANTPVWSEGMTEWESATKYFSTPPPSPSSYPIPITQSAVLQASSDESFSGSQVRPWIRFLARTIDLIVFSFLACIILAIIWPQIFVINDILLSALLSLGFIFVEPILFAKWGTTPGKWLLMIRVRNFDGSRMTYSEARERAFKVWSYGLGLGIPFIGFFTQIHSYYYLKKNGVTLWDKNKFMITHENQIPWKITIVITIMLFFVLLFFTNV